MAAPGGARYRRYGEPAGNPAIRGYTEIRFKTAGDNGNEVAQIVSKKSGTREWVEIEPFDYLPSHELPTRTLWIKGQPVCSSRDMETGRMGQAGANAKLKPAPTLNCSTCVYAESGNEHYCKIQHFAVGAADLGGESAEPVAIRFNDSAEHFIDLLESNQATDPQGLPEREVRVSAELKVFTLHGEEIWYAQPVGELADPVTEDSRDTILQHWPAHHLAEDDDDDVC